MPSRVKVPEQAGSAVGRRERRTVRLLAFLAIGVLTAAMARPAHAQFGALRRLKDKVTGGADSATAAADSAKRDSARVAAHGAADTIKAGQSMFQRAKSVASKASDKFEATTGISAKDAALAATGVGVAGIVAKKAGMPDMSPTALMNASKVAQAAGTARQATPGVDMSKLAMPGVTAMPNTSAGLSAADAARNLAALSTNTESAALLEFQQELMEVAMKASSGDAAARARLDVWQALLMKYQPEMIRLSTGVAATQPETPKKLMDLQLAMMSEWRGKRAPKVVKP
ncbi:MAG: hypothetical protein ABJD07_06600 [Gemmatimonadaceae bacterium]